MKALFSEGDASGDGVLQFEELAALLATRGLSLEHMASFVVRGVGLFGMARLGGRAGDGRRDTPREEAASAAAAISTSSAALIASWAAPSDPTLARGG